MNVLAFGEILWDIIEGQEHLGGAPFNFAAHAAQCGNSSFIISRLGNDFLGTRAYNECRAYGVDNSLIQWHEELPTGIVDVTLEHGQPDYHIRKNVAYDFIEYDAVCSAFEKFTFDVFYYGTLVQRNGVSASTLKKILTEHQFRHIFYDVNLRKETFTEAIIRESLRHCTILKLNVDEVPVLSKMLVGEDLIDEQFCAVVTELFPNIKIVIITAAEMGCYLYEDKKLTHVPGVPVSVTDAVGAGDAFSAAFMHVFSLTHDAKNAAALANQIGAFVAGKRGAVPEYSAHLKNILTQGVKNMSNVSQNIL
ncbi:PfkB family carbohydrate kinase [Parachryseolinea silvisoli]|uniref:PfkB family carbohydrate kinase n=1 Tax=Parachryseolinea silvisoli TaxID=2873601 RepID=UPI002265932E|nr:PfkB family carbohydrate kinase [Parachryseolinea silvisoli]MCD9017155.1 carbohydrate kinase [Parachryseolinea silvisoli]